MSWRERAACRDTDPAVFYPTSASGRILWMPEAFAEAAAVCADCPVRAECLDELMSWEPADRRHGYRGGATPGERAVLAGQSVRRCPCGTPLYIPTGNAVRFCSAECRRRHQSSEVRVEVSAA